MRPHFKRFFRSMAQKDLLLSDACLPFCGHSLLFFCRRFLFQIKRKCRNAEGIHPLIKVRSKGRNQLSTIQPYYNFVSASPISDSRQNKYLRKFRAACAASVRRVAAPYKLHGNKSLQIVRISRQIPVCRTDKKEPSFLTAPIH